MVSSIIDILVPNLPESITDATVATWHKKPGDNVIRDEVLVEIETDKVVLEVPALINGILEVVIKDEGTTVTSCQILGRLRECNSNSENKKLLNVKFEEKDSVIGNDIIDNHQLALLEGESNNNGNDNDKRNLKIQSPSCENSIDYAACIKSDDISKHLTDESVDQYLTIAQSKVETETKEPSSAVLSAVLNQLGARSKRRIPMTRLRKRMTERLLQAKNSIAMLTTFNEVNMKYIIDLRKRYGEVFEKRHSVRLGFMSFYVKAVIEALKRYPTLNASIDGDDIVLYDYYDLSIAISTPRGLVTPILRDANMLSVADIEKKIKELTIKARCAQLTVDDLTGGNFTITNGGVFGSLMSTPIINPPLSAILGIHAIKDRPMAIEGKVKILPMMYLALSYDHRLIDGRESIGFLVAIKELLEDPIRCLLKVLCTHNFYFLNIFNKCAVSRECYYYLNNYLNNYALFTVYLFYVYVSFLKLKFSEKSILYLY